MDDQQERLEISLEWFAGFFEAEGWFSLMKTMRTERETRLARYVPSCGLSNTDFSICDKIKKLFSKHGIEAQFYTREGRKKGYKTQIQINICGFKKCIFFLELIIPYMRGEKTQKAKDILEFCLLRREKTKGFCGIPYSQDEINLFDKIRSKILNDYKPNTEKVMI